MSLALVVAGKSSSESHRLKKQTKEKETTVVIYFKSPLLPHHHLMRAHGWAEGSPGTCCGMDSGAGSHLAGHSCGTLLKTAGMAEGWVWYGMQPQSEEH